MEPVYKYFEGVFGLGGLVFIIILCGLGIVIWKVATNYAISKHKADNLPCDKHDSDIKELTKGINDINISLGKMEIGLDGVNKIVTMIAAGSSGYARFTQSHSPISLTELGKEIANKLNFDNLLSENWEKIQSIIDTEKNPYDIQMEFITQFIANSDKYLNGDSLDKIKNDAYIRGVPLIDYMRMLGVMARDKYFLEHNIEISEVDRNDPTLSNHK